MNTSEPQKITTRDDTESCRCGCNGQDPWHKASYKRIVKNIVDVTPSSIEGRSEHSRVVVATGTAQFPWGAETVVQHARVWNGGLTMYRNWTVKRTAKY